jgi:metallophosphoesterase superfamily enzyme
VLGNHDKLINRKAFNAGLSARWIKTIDEMLGFTGWKFHDEYERNGVLYVHGDGMSAVGRMRKEIINVVQGHYHRRSGIQMDTGRHVALFAMQLGALIDDNAYAFAYGRAFGKSETNCGVVDINGTPIIERMI